MLVSLIACVAKNGIIGSKGVMPWAYNKEEMDFFKEKTTNHPVIMGRKTYESLKIKPLKDRMNIVVTHDKELQNRKPSSPLGPVYVSSIVEGIDLCDDLTNEIFVIGGAQIYNDAITQDLIDRMYINVLLEDYEGDTSFPFYEQSDWLITPSEKSYNSFKSYLLQKRKQDI